jgi:hypothetical protein
MAAYKTLTLKYEILLCSALEETERKFWHRTEMMACRTSSFNRCVSVGLAGRSASMIALFASLERYSGMFLIPPRTFRRCISNPVALAELAYLVRDHDQRQNRLAQATFCVLFTTALCGVLILQIASGSHEQSLYAVGLLIGFTFCLWVELRVFLLAHNAVWRESKPGNWEQLILTGIDARRIVSGKWQAIVHYSRPTVVTLTVLKIALAFTIMQYLNVWWIYFIISKGTEAFDYFSYPDALSPEPTAWYPGPSKILVAGIVVIIFSLLEVSLIAALGTLLALIKRSSVPLLATLFSVVRLASAAISIASILLISDFGTWALTEYSRLYGEPCTHVPSSECPPDNTNWYSWRQSKNRLLETFQVAASTYLDSGALLAANVMRPIGSWQFVLRNLVAALFGIICYILLIKVILRLAQFAAIRRGASRPIDT